MSADSRAQWSKTKNLKQKLFSIHHRDHKVKLEHRGIRKKRCKSQHSNNLTISPPLTPRTRSTTHPINRSIDITKNNDLKSLWIDWRPSLQVIFQDKQLLSALFTFMQRSLAEESILFLQSVYQLNAKINAVIQHKQQTKEIIKIDNQISSVYQLYIAPSAKYQINLSSDCFLELNTKCQSQFLSSYNLNNKRKIFDKAIYEIELLMVGVLTLFYQSHEFQTIVQTKMFNISKAPIILSVSQSTPAAGIAAMVGAFNDAQITQKFGFHQSVI